MAADEKRSVIHDDPERTLSDSPEDTTPPAEDATLIQDSLVEQTPAQEPDDQTVFEPLPDDTDKTVLGDVLAAQGEAQDDATLIENPAGTPHGNTDQSRTMVMDAAVDHAAADESAATMIQPSGASSSDDDATLIGHPDALPDGSEQTRVDDGSSWSDTEEKTLVIGAGSNVAPGTASGTATDYVPAAGEQDRDYPSLGRFEIQKLLGQGAFGAVYLAHDPHLDRKVAIKVAKTGVLVGKQDVDRFMREARSAAQLRHPNIVPVYEVGQLPNTNFIAYEYVEGRTLGDLMKERKKLTCEEAANYMRKIASGLDYAHQHGIIHRDMKPDNVLLDVNNEPHIADFGLARRDEGDTTRTREGMFMGTPSYMSPEQASGRAHLADARSDVWSLGVMLQEMLTGVRPFRGNVTEVLVAVQNYEPPSVRTLDHNIPQDLETIVEKCLTKKLDERYQSAQMLADELERWQRGEPILARPIGVMGRTWRWMKRNPQIASLIGVILLTFFVGALISTLFGISATNAKNLAHQQALQRAEAQLTSVRTADAASLSVLIDSLKPYRDELYTQLASLTSDEDLSDLERSRMRLAATTLFPDDPQQQQRLTQSAEDLLQVSPTELVVRTGLLREYKEPLEQSLWETAQQRTVSQHQRFQALAALASLRSTLPDWPMMASDMVAEMLTFGPLELADWLPAVRPIRDQLEPALTEAFTTGSEQSQQYAAAVVLAELFRDAPETLVGLVPQAEPNQLAPLLQALQPQADLYADRLTQQLDRILPSGGTLPSDEQAQQAAKYALALIGLRRGDQAWPLLQRSPNESLRTSLIHSISPAGVRWEDVVTRLEWDQDPGIIAALCLVLGEYGDGELLPGDRLELTPKLLEIFKTHPDAGVHSAAEWVLRRWGFDEQVNTAVAELKSRRRDPALGWHIDTQGLTFAVIEPETFLMGSPESLRERVEAEVQHRRLIPRTFGMATREVTISEYEAFDAEYRAMISRTGNRRYAPEDTGPAIRVSWYDAIAFCRWLSEKDGLEEREMCYPTLEDLAVIRKQFGAKSLELPEDLLDRTGYRLPTSAEWEYAARAGTETLHPAGNSALVGEYAWYRDNGKNHSWPTGLRKPNNFGFFDLQGNVAEWCQNYYFDTPPEPDSNGVVVDGRDPRDGINRELRGGSSMRYALEAIRVAYPDFNSPNTSDFDIGFRVARTYRSTQGSKAKVSEAN